MFRCEATLVAAHTKRLKRYFVYIGQSSIRSGVMYKGSSGWFYTRAGDSFTSDRYKTRKEALNALLEEVDNVVRH